MHSSAGDEQVAERESDEAKRKRILEGSQSLFFRQGISSLTMDQIAALQGISKKTLYKYFANKMELVEAALEDRIQRIAAEVYAVVDDHARPFPRRMAEVLGVLSRQLALLGDRLLNDIVYREPHLWERIDRFRREKVFGAMSSLLQQGISDGFVRTDIEARLIPMMFLTTLTTIMSPPQFFELTSPPAVIFQTVTRVLLGGILTEDGRAQLRLAEAVE